MKFHLCKISFPLFRAQDQVLELISFHDDALKSSNGFITYQKIIYSPTQIRNVDDLYNTITVLSFSVRCINFVTFYKSFHRVR